MCNYETCRRTYLSQRDLQAHVQHRHIRRSSNTNNGFASTISTTSSNQSNQNNQSLAHSANLVTSQKSSNQSPSSSSSSSSLINRIKSHQTANTSFQGVIPIVTSRGNLTSVPLQEEIKSSNSVSVNSNLLPQSQVTSGQSVNPFPPPPQPFLAHPRAHISWPTLHGSLTSAAHPPFSSPTLNPFNPTRFETFPTVGTTSWPLQLPHPPFNRPFYP